MTPAHQQAEELFQAVLPLKDEQARACYLDAHCHDPKVRSEVESLLAAHAAPDTLFESKTAAPEYPPSARPGMHFGAYKLLEHLGEGGFGSVWLAEQREPVRRKVALKLIKTGMDSRQVLARFEVERQALALMDHPNIAKVLDAGASPRPFFVMELVRGIPITQFCQENRLPLAERLKLCIQVCHALQHAHQKGIIHRDIKPSNVLVTVNDGVPIPKVIDFGIAKSTQVDLTEMTLHTQFMQFLGTPAYISPEQAEMSSLDVDTRSDVYSLGVLLYELLTEVTPFDAKELIASGIDGMRKTIREQEPRRPSTRLIPSASQVKEALPQGISPLPEIPDDLDWIVMKCLEKDRTRRYETTNALASDLQRFLTHEPILARPPSAHYKIRKFIRRNQVAVLAAATVVLVVLLALGTTTSLLVRMKRVLREKQEAEMARMMDQAMFAALSGDVDAMRLALEEAESQGATDSQLALLKGQNALARGMPEKAVELLGESVRKQPDSVAAHALLATAYVDAQRWQDYDLLMPRLLQLKEVTPQDYLLKGQALGFDRWDDALELLDVAVSKQPSALAHIWRSGVRATRAMSTGRTSDIEFALQDVAAAKAKSWSKDNLLMLINSCYAHVNAAQIYLRAGETNRYRQHLELADAEGAKLEALGTNPSAAVQRIHQLMIARRLDGPLGALPYLERLVNQQNARHPLILLRYGNALLFNGNSKGAIQAYNRAAGDDAIDTMRLMALLEIPEQVAKFDEEFQRYRQRYRGGQIEIYHPMFLLYAGRPAEAQQLARSLIKKNPEWMKLQRPHYQMAARYLAGMITEVELIESSEPSLFDLCDTHTLIGLSAVAQSNRPKAVEHFRKSIETGCFVAIQYMMADVAMAQLERHPNWPSLQP